MTSLFLHLLTLRVLLLPKELDKIINDLSLAGVNNILALRGDLPDGYDPDNPDYYHYAYELIEAIKSKVTFA